jgi:dolichyl-phosphate beta-glucosyltransferase
VPADRRSGRSPTSSRGRAQTEVEASEFLRPDVAAGECQWSVVIPAYNEAARLPRYLREVVSYFDGRNQSYEVLVDTQCGFKLFRGPVAEVLFGALGTEGFGFDVELLLLARRRGYQVVEVAINWADQPGSKVGVLRHAPGMFCEILAARWRLAVHAPPRRTP